MHAIFVLFTVSALVGLLMGLFDFSWIALAVSGVILAFISAILLRAEGLSAIVGIALIVSCLSVNQATFLIGVILSKRRRR
jgi:hypothetical protein